MRESDKGSLGVKERKKKRKNVKEREKGREEEREWMRVILVICPCFDSRSLYTHD